MYLFFVFFFASLQQTLSLFSTHLSLFLSLCFIYFSLTSLRLAGQGIAPSVMAPLPKRAALEKANGASAVFNTGMLQYQQALANMQFQQQAAFLPSGMAPKATTASALTTQRMPGSSNLAPAWLGMGKVVHQRIEQFSCELFFHFVFFR